MKILTTNAIYVQKVDLEFFHYNRRTLPASIIDKVFKNPQIDMDDYEKYDFIKFEEDDDIEFFQKTNWIIDYNYITSLSNEQIKQIGQDFLKQYDEVQRKLALIKSDNPLFPTLLNESAILNYQLRAINDALDIKNGLLKISLPPELKQNNIVKQLLRKIIKPH